MQLPISAIKVKPGHNPRGHFDPDAMRELENSIRANGLLQPILVRPAGESVYEIVAGERRYRACMAVYGNDGVIDVVVRDLDEKAADVAAAIENIQRESMSAAEEARAVRKILSHFNGDREAVATELGWPQHKVQRRLALLEATPAVLDALTSRRISLGHAELLAAAPKDKQDKVLEKVIAGNIPVSVLKQQLAAISHSLEAAVFDKSDCAACTYNSSLQAEMFGEALAAGHCTNPACFEAKTNTRIDEIASEQRENYPRVEIIRVGSGIDVIPLKADGDLGVGEAQFTACHGCGNFGCTVSALPGSEGVIEANVCFDTVCHTKKVAAHLKAVKGDNDNPAPAGKATGARAKPSPKANASANPNATPSKVKEYRVKVWKEALRAELDKSIYRAGAALAAIALTSNARCIDPSRIAGVDELKGIGRVGDVFKLITERDKGELSQLLAKLPVAAVEELSERDVCSLLLAMETNLSEHWRLDKDFLALLTKSEIEAVAEEVGLKAAMGDGFKKALTGKKDEVIAALLKAEGFDYSAVIPAVLRYQQDAQPISLPLGAAEDSDDEPEDEENCCTA